MTSTAHAQAGPMRDRDRWSLFVLALAVGLFVAGYAGGSVLAGEPLAAQLWAVPLLGGSVATMAFLAAEHR